VVEHAVDAVLGRALAVAAVQLLVRVVVAGDVPALDAHHRARLRRRQRRPADLTQHDEPGEEEDAGEREQRLHGGHFLLHFALLIAGVL